MPYFVSRQHTWPSGERYVEVVTGGRDYANPDMLVERYAALGEGREYQDPRAAVDAAIAICNAWRRDATDESLDVRCGGTGGFTIPFESGTFEEARAWAEQQYEALPKCARCGDILERRRFSHVLTNDAFCSETCAELDYHERFEPPEEE